MEDEPQPILRTSPDLAAGKLVVAWDGYSCVRCGEDRDVFSRSPYCSAYCKSYAKDIRYLRRKIKTGDIARPDIQEAVHLRLAHLVAGGYDSDARRLSPEVRAEVLSFDGGRCQSCKSAPATEVDHIAGPSEDRTNLQGLCAPCHHAKTAQSFQPMTEADKVVRDEFFSFVFDDEPHVDAYDEEHWDKELRLQYSRLARELAAEAHDDLDAYEYGDGGTGTEDDYEHGLYLQMLAERDD